MENEKEAITAYEFYMQNNRHLIEDVYVQTEEDLKEFCELLERQVNNF